MGRLLAFEESERLIAKYRPQRARIVWFRKREWWHSYAVSLTDGCTRIGARYPTTHFLALVFLHECAHVVDRGVITTDKTPRHVYEYAAERMAMTWWRNEGYAVPPAYLRTAKVYVRNCIREDLKKDHPIKPHIARWSNFKV